MDEAGMWRFFFATGLPEAYLAVRLGPAGQADPRVQPDRRPGESAPLSQTVEADSLR